LVVALLAGLAILTLVPRLVHANFAADDWVDGARFRFHPGSGAWATVHSHQVWTRVTWAVVNSAEWAVLQRSPVAHLFVNLVVSVGEVVLLYLVLRRLGAGKGWSAGVAALVMVWPWADASRLWANGAQMGLAVCFLFGGLLVALDGRRSHVWASLLYALGVLDYELIAPAALAAGFVYWFHFGWARARGRWLLDVVFVAAALLFHSLAGHVSLAPNSLSHARVIATQAGDLLAATLVPGIPHLAALAVGAAVCVVAMGRRSDPANRRLLAAVAVGLAVIVLGYVMIVPADAGYVPDSTGMQNRINVVAAIGVAVVVVSVYSLAGGLIFKALRPTASDGSGRGRSGARTTFFLIGALVIALLATETVRFEQDANNWNAAGAEQSAVLGALDRLVPHPSGAVTVFTFGRSGFSAPSIPIFGGGGMNDLVGAVRILWNRDDVAGYPVDGPEKFACAVSGFGITGVAGSYTGYGRGYLVDLKSDRAIAPSDQRQCRASTAALEPYAPVNQSN
jgi:hypothetical protein